MPDSPNQETPNPSFSGGSLDPEVYPFLRELDSQQWIYSGTPAVMTLRRDWPDGSVDTLVVLSPDTAYIRRDDPGKGLVKDGRGTAVEMARLAHQLPAPDAPDAPSTPLRDARDPML